MSGALGGALLPGSLVSQPTIDSYPPINPEVPGALFFGELPPGSSLTLRTSVCVAVARHCSLCSWVNTSARRSWKAARTRCTASAS